MNLRGLANGLTRTVNPNRVVHWMRGVGVGQDPETGERFPVFDTVIFQANIQAVSSSELQLISAMNMEGYHRAVYINGSSIGPVRDEIRPGDVFKFGGRTWKVTQVPEDWDENGWSKVIVTMQQGTGAGTEGERYGPRC